MQVIEVNNIPEFEDAIGKSKIVVFDFWAEWCGPCKAFAKVIENLLTQNLELLEDVTIAKVNVEEVEADLQQVIAQQFRVSAIPTMFVFYNGGLVQFQTDNGSIDRIVGALPPDAFLELIKAVKSIDNEPN